MQRCGSDEMTETARQRVRTVPVPEADPVFGKNGPLIESWRR
jgi:uncharacterized protein YjlB